MIPQAYIIEWSNHVPWQTNEQVEQDLVICRAIVAIFQDPYLAQNLAFRGGTALHKLYLQSQLRYSEDIDLVQIKAAPFGPLIDRIKTQLSFLGVPKVKQKENNNTLIYRFESEFPPIQTMRLKIETNCREHFSVMGFERFPFLVRSGWFNGDCNITTYSIEELLGSKLRALYQRSKGRDLFDIYMAISTLPQINPEKIISCYRRYMSFAVEKPPGKQLFIENLASKIENPEFPGDIKALIRSGVSYNPRKALERIIDTLINRI